MKILPHITKLICVAALISVTTAAHAKKNKRSKIYARADAGYSYVHKKMPNYAKKLKGAPFGTAGIGYIFTSRFKTDLTLSYRGDYKYSGIVNPGNYRESQDISSTALMWNGYLNTDLKIFDQSRVYLMGGIGISINKAGDMHVRSGTAYILGDYKKNFVWQVGVGNLFKIQENLDIDLMYKYVDLGTVTTKGVGIDQGTSLTFAGPAKGKLRAHEISLGLIYKF